MKSGGAVLEPAEGLSGKEIAQRSTRGSVFLFAGNFLSTAILAVSSVVIARLLGPASYGSYTLVLLIPQMFQLFVGLGVSSAITRYSAYHIARGQLALARRFSVNSMVFLTLFGVAFSLVCFATAEPVSAVLLHRPDLAPLVRYVSVVVLAQTGLQAAIAGLVGWNAMGLASFSSTLQAALRLSIAPVLVLSGFGVSGALAGFTAGYMLAGGAGGLAFYALKLRGSLKGESRRAFWADIGDMVSYGLPIYAGGVMIGLANYLVTLILAAVAADAVVGYYQAASNITAGYALALSAVTLALFPAFSSLHGAGADTASAFRRATKYVAFSMAPLTLFIAGGSGLIVRTLYGSAFSSAGTYLVLLAISDIPLVIGLIVATAFFNGIGRTRLSLAVGGVEAGSLFVAAPILGGVLGLGVDGLIFAQLLSNALAAVVALHLASRYLGVAAELRSIGAVFAASALALLAQVGLSALYGGGLLELVPDAFVFFFVYFTTAPILRAVDAADVEVLGAAIGGMGGLARLLRPILGYESMILRRLRRATAAARPAASSRSGL